MGRLLRSGPRWLRPNHLFVPYKNARILIAALTSRSRSGRVVTVRLNILRHQVSLNPPPNRTYTFPHIRLSEFSCAFFSSRLTFRHGVHHGVQYGAPSSS